jgi:hypothetical protein
MSNDGGPYQGPRDPNVDYFDDIMGDNSPPTIFDGDGFRDYEAIKWVPNAQGLSISMHCRACPRPCRIDVTWPELFVVSHAPRTNVLPQGWVKSEVNGAPFPNVRCNNCGAVCAPIITPEFAQKRVDAALRAGLTNQQTLIQDPQVRHIASLMAQAQMQRPPGY